MRRGGPAAIGLAAAGLAGLAGCGRKAPAPADLGDAVYAQWCVSCHQPDGRGMNGRLGADFVGDPSRLARSDDELIAAIAGGVPGTTMIGWRNTLSDAEISAVVGALRRRFGAPAVGGPGGPTPD